jgi:methyl-accepting chemotaxis protein
MDGLLWAVRRTTSKGVYRAMWKNLSLSTRMALIGLVPTICFGVALLWIHSTLRSSNYEGKTERLRELVQGAWSVVDYYGELARTGKMTTEDAQNAAKIAVRHMIYGKTEGTYFWINTLEPRMVMNAIHPELEGKDLSAKKDPNGVYIFQEMVNVCRKQGEGRVDYSWLRSDTKQNAPKINYVKLYAPWGWIIGTGLYVDDVEAELRSTAWILLGVSAGALILALLVGVPVLRSINQPIMKISAQLRHASVQVGSAAGQVASASQVLSQDSAAQAASLEETSSAGEEISAMSRRNAANSQDSADHMNKTSELVTEANQKLGNMIQSMKEIQDSSNQISKIIKVIDEIAFQTNILALNAAVEAARAGEAGMGFAVVADEVRNLAQRSAQAARDTASLIEDSIQRTREGATRLDEVAQSIAGITQSASAVRDLVDQVRVGSHEQAQGLQQVATALAEMGQRTQKAAATAEESAAAGVELTAQAKAMDGSVEELNALVRGRR